MNFSFHMNRPIHNKAFIFLGFVFLVVCTVSGQNPKLADSLENIYKKGLYEEEE